MWLDSGMATRSCLVALLCIAAWVTGVANAGVGELAGGRGNAADEMYQSALSLIANQQYSDALATLRRLQARHPGFERLNLVQTRIAVLHEAHDAGSALQPFLEALTLRDTGHVDAAVVALAVLLDEHAESSLHDDALYLTAYVQIMDRYDFATARQTLKRLHNEFPDTAYRDSADYLDAIALEQLGDTVAARQALLKLRERHTALSLPMGFRWPTGSVLSRYWFDRADRRLAILDQQVDSASTLRRRRQSVDGRLHIRVNVEGVDMDLVLSPSQLTRETAWRDGHLQDLLPPGLGVYSGHVDGVADSWVRAVMTGNAIAGVVVAHGHRYQLQPGNLIGTLDYYQPRRRVETGQSQLEQLLQLDMLPAPPNKQPDFQRRNRSILTDLRLVPVSFVIDSQFDRYYGGTGLATAINQLNVADGIYRQFGLALSLDEAVVFVEGQVDPMDLGPTTVESMLRGFRDYRLQHSTLFSGSALAYLFTGNPKTDATLGLAWINTSCRTDGYDVGVTTPGDIGELLLTHELGHSLGSPHDTDTPCKDDSGKLMWPQISARTVSEFSHCSREYIQESRSKSCFLNAVDLSLSVSLVGSTVEFVITNPDSVLALDARLVVETAVAEQLHWPAGCRALTPTSAECAVDRLAAGEQRVVAMPLQSLTLAGQAVTGHLAPRLNTVRDIQLGNNVASLSTAVNPGGHIPLSSEASNALAGGAAASDSRKSSGLAATGWWLLTGLTMGAGLRLRSGIVKHRALAEPDLQVARHAITQNLKGDASARWQ
jgi:outer membrane protein assembly factor BamD (BamD/ComL family)